MALTLTPRLQHAGFLRAVVAGIYAAGMQPEDYLVLARRSDLAATRTTELLKARSEAGENLRIARSKLNSHLQNLQRDDADRRIFLSDQAEPAPRRLFGLFNVPTPELRRYEQRRKALEDALAATTARHRDAESLVKSRHAQLDRLIKEHDKQETERDSLREATIRAGVFLLLHHQAAGNLTEALQAFEQARERARGDRRLYLTRVFVEALTEGPAAAFTMVRDLVDIFAGESAPEATLAKALVHFAGDNRLTARDLPPLAADNYSAPEHFALHAFLAAAAGLPAALDVQVPAEHLPLIALARGWHSGDFASSAFAAPAHWQADLPRTELLAAATLSKGRPLETLAMFGINPEELTAALGKARRGKEIVQVACARIADARIRFGPLYQEIGERCVCLLLLALREAAADELYALAREELRASACGNIYELLRAREMNREPRFRRVPEEFYWEELTND